VHCVPAVDLCVGGKDDAYPWQLARATLRLLHQSASSDVRVSGCLENAIERTSTPTRARERQVCVWLTVSAAALDTRTLSKRGLNLRTAADWRVRVPAQRRGGRVSDVGDLLDDGVVEW
jgi:hypothetical protein